MTIANERARAPALAGIRRKRRTLAACGGAHILHDGLGNALYVLFPLWQAAFGLSLAEIGLLKTVYSGALAGLQLPAGVLAERGGERALLVLGTALAGLGLVLAGWSQGFLSLALCLALSGAGSSVQHPISSSLIARAYEKSGLRAALGTYNFAGDLGKVALPAAAAWLIALLAWRSASIALGSGVIVAALAALAALGLQREARPAQAAAAVPNGAAAAPRVAWSASARRGFVALAAIGVVDSATRSGFLVFLPFLLGAKGAGLPTIGLAMSLVFAGGATGKFVCGLLADRVGILRSVIITECATSAGILALLPLSLSSSLILLPAIGLALNGTSSVLYGTVAELAPAERRARAFGLFYTLSIGGSALSPAFYGVLSDSVGLPPTLAVVAAVVLLVVPLTLPLRAPLRELRTP
ncbi:MAG TPA: MFS transporter [Alphaproteobacteria bacterium]|nr:MFS transporter [Alphaproteobacteria bacterium]